MEVLLSVQRVLGAVSSSGRWAVHDSLPSKSWLQLNSQECAAGCQVRECHHSLRPYGQGQGWMYQFWRAGVVCICCSSYTPLEESIYCLVYVLCLWSRSGSMHLILFSYGFRIHLRRWGPFNEKMIQNEDLFPKKLQNCQDKLLKGISIFRLGCWPKANIYNYKSVINGKSV